VCSNSIRATGGGDLGSILLTISSNVTDMIVEHNSITNDAVTNASIYIPLAGEWLHGSISHNSISNANAAGIYVRTTGAAAGGSGLVGVSINDNQIRTSVSTGIRIYAEDGASTPVLQNIQIASNRLDDNGDYGILIDALTGVDLDTIAIKDNTIRTITSDGVRINTSGGTDTQGLHILGNTFRDISGSGISYVGTLMLGDLLNAQISNNLIYGTLVHGISIVTASADVQNCIVSGNDIRNWGTNGSVYAAVGISCIEAHNVNVTDNVVFTTRENSIGYLFEITGVVRNFIISDNTADLQGAANTESMRFDTSLGADQLGVSITGNTFRGAVTGVNDNASSFAPDRSVCANNAERTNGGAGNWAAFVGAFGVNSITTPNQD
jgi:hypothetical protein